MAGSGGPLQVVRSSSLELLAEHLTERLRTDPPADPVAPIEVAVPSRGMERWLTQRLSSQLGATATEAGVCANVRFPFLGGVLQRTLAATLGEDGADADPWTPQRLAWPLVALLDDLADDPAFGPLWTHLSDDGVRSARRRLPLARRIADLFDRYALYRPDMVAAWRDGAAVDGEGASLPPNLRWQPPLWCELTERIDTPSPDLRTTAAIDRLRRGTVARPDQLPTSVTVFGVLGLPPRHLELLAALATSTPVTLYTVAPCLAWPLDDPRPEPRNPLLLASGAMARDAHTVLSAQLPGAVTLGPGDADPAAAPPHQRTALAVLQADVRGDRRRGPGGQVPALPWRPGDRTVQVHACHGPVRQLEVLKQVLLGLFEDDPTLEPRDVVVLTPDIETYAPLVPAVFPRRGGDATDLATDVALHLPVRVADRTLREDNAVAQALLAVLELATGRVTASQVLDLLASPPVRARAGLSDADLQELPRWVLSSGVSWGIDAEHRRQLIDLDDGAHTWAAALDRWTLGAAMADDSSRMVGGVLPFDDVEGAGVELLGRVMTATDALFSTLRELAAPRPVDGWCSALSAATTSLFDPGPGPQRDAALTAQLAEVRRVIDQLADDAAVATGGPSDVAVTLEEVRGLLAEQLSAGAGVAATGTGAVTVTGLVPLRNVPHRVVCLVGLDDGALPRPRSQHGFDLLEVADRPGDPDPRREDRQLLLDAVLSATDHLVVTYAGHDPRTNERLQPAVAISELLDTLTASFDGPVEVTWGQPLQPHSPRYFRDAIDGEDPVLRAFDPHHLAAARAVTGATAPVPAFLDPPLPPPPADLVDPTAIDLDELVRFLAHPVRFLLQRRFGLVLGEDDRRLPDRDPTELDGLQRWQLGQQLLERRLADTDIGPWRRVTMAAGTAPVGGLGEVALEGIEQLVDTVLGEVADLRPSERALRPVELDVVPVGAGVDTARLVGAVEVVGGGVLQVGVSSPKPKHLVAAWVRVLALLATEPTLAPRAVLVGGDRGLRSGVRRITLDPTAAFGGADGDEAPEPGPLAAQARQHLGELVALFLRGHREVVALPPDTAEAYADARAKGAGHAEAVRSAHFKVWAGGGPSGGDRDDAYHVQAFGPASDLAEIDRRHPFGADADRLWGVIRAAQGKGSP